MSTTSNESILTSIKKLLGIEESYTQFDLDIITHINSVFLILNQMGVGPDAPFYISDSTQTWTDFTEDITKLEMVKSYVYLKVRLLFDPPTSSALLDSMKNLINEYEWRLNIQVDPGDTEA